MLPARSSLVCLIVAATTIVVGCGGSKSSASRTTSSTTPTTAGASGVTPPDTPAGAQARWLLTAARSLPIPDAAIRAHFDSALLNEISPAMLNAGLEQVGASLPGGGRVELVSIDMSKPRMLVAAIARPGTTPRLSVVLSVDSRGLIDGLLFRPLVAPVTSWHAIDENVRSVAPHARMLVADITSGSCKPLHTLAPGTPAPLGSAFKLYVLDALGSAVASGKLRWNDELTVTAKLKSLPSGTLQNEPDGTAVPVRTVAAKMISISDNTAADMLINRVGRTAVEAAATGTGMADPGKDRPFPTTRELFILKLHEWPTLATRYAQADETGRRQLLAREVDTLPLPPPASAKGWTTPRDIDRLEWFASANDVCRAYASLFAMAKLRGLHPIADVLELNDGGLGLDRSKWKATWFKGGSEPGVLTLTYLATTRSGRTYVVAVLAENPTAPISHSADLTLLAAVKGAFALAAHGSG